MKFTILLFVISGVLLCDVIWAQEHKNTTQQPDFSLVGFATETTGTTGGQNGEITTVTTGTELQNALNNHENNTEPLIIVVDGTVTSDNSDDLSRISVYNQDNLSIIGSVEGAEFDGIGIKVTETSNLIIRNLKIHNVLLGPKDGIGIDGPADHIWIDHCELYSEYGDIDGDGDEDDDDKDYYDGLLDIRGEAEYITVSWSYLHDSWKTSLVGSSESDTYDRKLTIHHNYYENCYSRLPLFRGKTGHIFNCYYHNIVHTAINTRLGSCIRIEENYFDSVNNPWVSAYSDELGGAELINNKRVNSEFDFSRDDTFEVLECEADIPYSYEGLMTTLEQLNELVPQYAGVGKLSDPVSFKVYVPDTVDIDTNSNAIQSKTKPISINLFPNPATNNVYIKVQAKGKTQVKVSVFNSIGTLVYEQSSTSDFSGDAEYKITTSKFPKGIYFVNINSNQGNIVQKFIKE